ncbi:MAG: hypothetical protein A2Z11_02860 [Candidatus Woykebacteria bacterium RBG_16_43_9]|uniref:Uncharacterized protein n=1 Tax=Candidatus Woykebacteria bacterium RBG_16_43_9 TaxID=1802596 RepID=A0A1G1WCQ7_9BACT|nr:MAG: hypothetical protein A2Z11_02860 [Candidatus Woykebacteria bacterium RBG_16_43_9]
MKKNFIKLLKKQQLIITLSIIFSVILVVLLGPAIYIRFVSWRSIASVNTQDLEKLRTTTENVSLLANINGTRLDIYKDLIEKMVPKESDQLRVVSIIDELVKKSKVTLKSIKVGGGSGGAATAAPTASGGGPAAQPQSSDAGESTPPTTTTAPASTSTTPTVQTGGYNLNITFEGTFSNTLQLLGLLENTKRTIGVKNIIITRGEKDNILTITADFSLPLSKDTEVTSQDRVAFTQKDADALSTLLSKLTIDALPTNLPTGRSDPFN